MSLWVSEKERESERERDLLFIIYTYPQIIEWSFTSSSLLSSLFANLVHPRSLNKKSKKFLFFFDQTFFFYKKKFFKLNKKNQTGNLGFAKIKNTIVWTNLIPVIPHDFLIIAYFTSKFTISD